MYPDQTVDAVAFATIQKAVNHVHNLALTVFVSMQYVNDSDPNLKLETPELRDAYIRHNKALQLVAITREFARLDEALRLLIGPKDLGADCPPGECRIGQFCVPCPDLNCAQTIPLFQVGPKPVLPPR